MEKINGKRLVLAGVVAAVVVNVGEGIFGFLMRNEYESAIRALGVDLGNRAAAILPVLWSIAVGVISMWLYAAIRPLYGAGKGTVGRAAVAVWALSTATFAIAMGSLGLFPVGLMALAAVWSLVEMIVALYVGSLFYKEG